MSIPISNSQVWLKREVMDLQPVVRTSKPYPVIEGDECLLTPAILISGLHRLVIAKVPLEEGTQLTPPSIVGGVFRASVLTKLYTEGVDASLVQLTAVNFRRIVIAPGPLIEETQLSYPVLVSGILDRIVIEYSIPEASGKNIQLSLPTLIGGSFARP